MFWPMRLTYSVDHRIGDELGALLDLLGVLLAHLDLGVGGVPVAHAAAADVAIADGVDVVDASRAYVDLLAAGLDDFVGIDFGSGDSPPTGVVPGAGFLVGAVAGASPPA